MAQDINVVGSIPEFTQDSASETGAEELKKTTGDEPVVEETATPEIPAEKPADGTEIPVGEDTTEPQPVVQAPVQPDPALKGLQEERVKLIKEIAELRGQKREIKKQELATVDHQIDELKDLNPDDIKVIDRVMRAKGYMTKEEINQMSYKAVEQDELGKFLNKYPEYKPENDPGDVKWTQLQNELGLYKLPSDARQIGTILERAHRAVQTVPTGTPTPQPQATQRRIQVAGAGAGGGQRPSQNSFRFDADKRAMLARGGWSEKEIQDMEAKSTS